MQTLSYSTQSAFKQTETGTTSKSAVSEQSANPLLYGIAGLIGGFTIASLHNAMTNDSSDTLDTEVETKTRLTYPLIEDADEKEESVLTSAADFEKIRTLHQQGKEFPPEYTHIFPTHILHLSDTLYTMYYDAKHEAFYLFAGQQLLGISNHSKDPAELCAFFCEKAKYKPSVFTKSCILFTIQDLVMKIDIAHLGGGLHSHVIRSNDYKFMPCKKGIVIASEFHDERFYPVYVYYEDWDWMTLKDIYPITREEMNHIACTLDAYNVSTPITRILLEHTNNYYCQKTGAYKLIPFGYLGATLKKLAVVDERKINDWNLSGLDTFTQKKLVDSATQTVCFYEYGFRIEDNCFPYSYLDTGVLESYFSPNNIKMLLQEYKQLKPAIKAKENGY